MSNLLSKIPGNPHHFTRSLCNYFLKNMGKVQNDAWEGVKMFYCAERARASMIAQQRFPNMGTLLYDEKNIEKICSESGDSLSKFSFLIQFYETAKFRNLVINNKSTRASALRSINTQVRKHVPNYYQMTDSELFVWAHLFILEYNYN